MRRTILFACQLLASLSICRADARQYTVDDLLKLESYGDVALSRPEGLVLVERRRPYDEASDYGYGANFNGRMLTRLLFASISRPGPLRPLFAQERDAGYWMGGLSPSGRRLAVYRLRRRVLSLGVVDLRTRAVRWLPGRPDVPTTSPNPIWLDDDRLVFIAMTGPRLPGPLLLGAATKGDLDPLYERQARGGYSGTSISSVDGPAPDATLRRLVIASASSGTAREVFRGDVVDVALAPDGRRVAVMTAGLPVAPPAGPISVSFDPRRHAIQLVDLASGTATPPVGDAMRGFMSWSDDGRLLALVREDERDWRSGHYASIDRRGRAIRLGGDDAAAAVFEQGGGRLCYAGWAGSVPVALMADPDGASRWMRLLEGSMEPVPIASAARPTGSTGGALWLVEGGRVIAIGKGMPTTVAEGVIATGTSTLEPFSRGFRTDMNPTAPELLFRRDGRRNTVRVIGPGVHGPEVTIAPEREVLAVAPGMAITSMTDVRAGRDLRLERTDLPPILLDRLNRRVADVALPKAISLSTPQPGGADLMHWLLLPPGAGRRLPVVVIPYPGMMHSAKLPREAGILALDFSTNALLLTAAGFAVLLPGMPRDPSGRNPTPDIVPQVHAALDAAAMTGRIDVTRVGVLGHSFGGYAALTLATGSSRFRAVVASNGLADLAAMHGAISGPDKLRLEHGLAFPAAAGWTEAGQGGMLVPPYEDPAAYVAASPAFRMNHAKMPLLLMAGDVDPVDMAQFERAFMEAARNGVDARLVRFWGEGHEVSSPGNVREQWRIIVRFFDRNLRSASASAKIMPVDRGRRSGRAPGPQPRFAAGEQHQGMAEGAVKQGFRGEHPVERAVFGHSRLR